MKKSTLTIVYFFSFFAVICFLIGNYSWFGIFILLVAYSCFDGVNTVFSNIQNANRNRSIAAWHNALDKVGRFFFAVCLILWMGDYSFLALLGFTLSSLFILYSSKFFYQKKIGDLPSLNSKLSNDVIAVNLKKDILKYASPIFYWGAFTWLHISSDKWALEIFNSTHEVGLYYVLYQLGFQTVLFCSTFLALFVGPILYDLVGDIDKASDSNGLIKMRNYTLGLMVVISLIFFIISLQWHDLIFSYLVGKDFQSVSYLFPYVILASSLYAWGDICSLQLQAHLRTDLLLYPRVGVSIIGIVSNIIGSILCGIKGVVYGTLLSYALFFLWVLFLIRKHNDCYSIDETY